MIKGNHTLTPAAKLTLIALADRHNKETGRCDPSVQRIADDVGMSVTQVRRGLRQLEKSNIIKTVFRKITTGAGKRNLNNRYKLLGTVNMTGGVRSKRPTNLTNNKSGKLSAFDDLAFSISDDDYDF